MKCLLSFFFAFVFLAEFSSAQETVQSIPAPQPAEPVRLIPQFIPGKTYKFTSLTVVRLKLMGQPGKESLIVLEQDAELKASKRPAGKPGVHLMASTTAVKFRMEAGGKKIAFDSADEKSLQSPIGKHFQNSLMRWTQIELSPEGKMESRTDGGGGGAATPLPHLPEVGPNQLQQLVGTLIANFPPDPVAPGKEWIHTGETKLGQFGNMKFKITNQYTSDEQVDGATCAVIQFKGEIDGDVKVQAANSEENLDFRGTKMSGTYVFDKKLGVTRINEQIVLMQINNPNLPETTVEQQVKIRLTAVEDNAP